MNLYVFNYINLSVFVTRKGLLKNRKFIYFHYYGILIPIKWIYMFTKEINVAEVFERTPWESLTFSQIKQISKIKSDNYVFNTLKKLVLQKVLSEKRYGKTVVYSVAKTIEAIKILSLVSEYKSENKNIPNAKELINLINTAFFTFLITGSYAVGKQTKESDLDVAVICDDERNKKEILVPIMNKGELLNPKIHIFVFTQKEFYGMLVNKEENYGKEIARKHLIMIGAQSYYKILFEAINNGFKG
jgi:predicted nucleotidyltransferase